MPIFDFIKMETLYSKIYMVKCARVMEQVSEQYLLNNLNINCVLHTLCEVLIF